MMSLLISSQTLTSTRTTLQGKEKGKSRACDRLANRGEATFWGCLLSKEKDSQSSDYKIDIPIHPFSASFVW